VKNEPRDHGENGGVGADAESQGEDDHRGEGGCLGQGAQCQTQVPGAVLQKPPNPYCADFFLYLLDAAEFNHCLPEGHRSRQSIFHLLLRQNFHRRPEFVVQCLFDRVLAQEVPEQTQYSPWHYASNLHSGGLHGRSHYLDHLVPIPLFDLELCAP